MGTIIRSAVKAVRRPQAQKQRASTVSERFSSGSDESQRHRRLRTVRGDVHPKGFGGDRKAPETGRASFFRPKQSYERDTQNRLYAWSRTEFARVLCTLLFLCLRAPDGADGAANNCPHYLTEIQKALCPLFLGRSALFV